MDFAEIDYWVRAIGEYGRAASSLAEGTNRRTTSGRKS